MPNEIKIEEKNELEEKAMVEILNVLPNNIKENYYAIWEDYTNNVSTESRFVHELDKLEMALQAKIYEKNDESKNIKPFITSAVDSITDNDLKKILLQIIQ